MKAQVDYKPKQLFLNKAEGTIWYLVDITEVKSLILDAKKRTIVHLFNEDTKRMKRLRFPEFESQFEPLQNNLPEKVVFFNKCLEINQE